MKPVLSVDQPTRTAPPRAWEEGAVRLGLVLYRYRSYTALPLLLLLLLCSRPSILPVLGGLPFIALGEALRIWSLRYIGGGSRSRHLGGDRLVAAGPYAMVRNPLYAGNFLLTLGFAILSGRPWFLLVPAFLFPVQYVPIVLAEEKELTRRFPDSYPAYAERVDRFWPTLRVEQRGAAPHPLLEALRFERRSLWTVVSLLLALSLAAIVRGG